MQLNPATFTANQDRRTNGSPQITELLFTC